MLVLFYITFFYSLYRTFLTSSLLATDGGAFLCSCESRSYFSIQLLAASPPLLSYLCCRFAYLFFPLGVYSSSHALPPLATALSISQPGNQPLLYNLIFG
jgi:hypothetical protein